MTIPASMPNRVVYYGDGVTVNFPIPFKYTANSDGTKQLKVYSADAATGESEVVLTENVDFTATDAGAVNGTLTTLTPLAADKKLTIILNAPVEQPTDWEEFGRLPSESIENAFDRVTIVQKQQQEILDRCVKVLPSGNQTPQELLNEVYDKLDSATEIAATATKAADNATKAANNATKAVENAEETLTDVRNYVDAGKTDIDNTVAVAKADIANTITQAVDDVKAQAVSAAEETIADAAVTVTAIGTENINEHVDGTIKPALQQYLDDGAALSQEMSNKATNFDSNYTEKLNAFNTNATAKTSEFNANAATKQAAVDKSASNAAASATSASTSAADALLSKKAAAISETNAMQSRLLAASYAERVRSEGIPMSIIEHKKIEKNGDTVRLYWQDPRDTIIDGFVLSSWKSTTIVKKQGSYPEDIDDGVVVGIYNVRDEHLDAALEDTQVNAENWYYRAFPLSVNGVYNLDKRNCFGVVLYGYRINEVDPVPATRVEYLPYCDNYFYDPCVMDFVADQFNWGSWRKAFFVPKPCALRYSGVVDYYINPDDFTKKEDGSASDIASSAYGGNFMVEFPSIFVKCWKENNYNYVLISNTKLDDSFECWATKKSDGTYAKNFYLPMFEGTNVNNVLRSYASTGKPTASTNAETEATYAMANGSGWNTTTWADELLMMLLFPLLFKSTDSQSVLGYGASASTSALTCNNNAAVSKGLMYGTKDASAYGINYLGMHNWYGHRWRRPNGLMNDNGNIKVKMTHSTIDGSTTTGYNRSGSGYISTGFVPPAASESYINRYQPVGKYGMFPLATSGSSTTYYCDGMWTNNGQLDQLILGGSVAHGAIRGAFCFFVNSLPSDAAWNDGASPSYHHL